MDNLTKAKIALLRGARDRIRAPYFTMGICAALRDTLTAMRKPQYDVHTTARKQLSSYIMESLYPYNFLGQWADGERAGYLPSYESRRRKGAVRTLRTQWIDWMIASLEGQPWATLDKPTEIPWKEDQ